MLLAEDPRSYVYHLLSDIAATDLWTTEEEKRLRLLDGLLAHLKKCVARDRPENVDKFTERLKNVRREQMYEQNTILQHVTPNVAMSPPGYVSSIANSDFSQALEQVALTALFKNIGLNQPVVQVPTRAILSDPNLAS